MPSFLNASGFPRTARPNIYAKVDASALSGGALESGNIAIVGDFPTFPSAEPVSFSSRRSMIAHDTQSSDLSMIAQLCFNPSSDPTVNAGASSVTIVNARESCAQASVNVGALTLKSRLYSLRGNTTRSTLSIVGDVHTLVIDRGGLSETFTVEGTAAATIANSTGVQIVIALDEGVMTVTDDQANTLLTVTTEEAADLRAALLLVGQLNGITTTLIEPRSIPLDELEAFTLTLADGASGNITATNQALFAEISNSSLVEATIDTSNTAGALAGGTLYFSGGAQGLTIDTAAALASIENSNIQIVVLHDFTEGRQVGLLAHLAAAARAGYERQGYVAIESTSNLSAIRARAAKLNSAEIALTCQSITLFDAKGRRVEKDSRFTALMLAGMQAGSDIGEPLTRKRPSIISTAQGFDTHADAEQALRSGAVFISQGPTGPRVERSITTHLEDNNPILSEISAYESVLSSVRDMRVSLADQIGRPTQAGQVAVIESRASARLAQQVRDGLIKAFANLTLEDLGDQVAISYDVAPLEPLNFITVTAITKRIN